MSRIATSDRPVRWSTKLQAYSLLYIAIAPQTRYDEAHFRQVRQQRYRSSMVITSFKVIQGQFWYQSKACWLDIILVNNTILHPIWHRPRFQLLCSISQIIGFDEEMLLVNPPFLGKHFECRNKS